MKIKILPLLLILTFLTGCLSPLERACLNIDGIKKGDIVKYYNKAFHVTQTFADSNEVLMSAMYGDEGTVYTRGPNYSIASHYDNRKLITIKVNPKEHQYADGDPMKSGFYKYTGIWKYTTTDNRNNTVKAFEFIGED